jgi:hypothetical protein
MTMTTTMKTTTITDTRLLISYEKLLQVHPLITTRPSRKNCSPKISADKKQASLTSKTQQSLGNSGEKVEQGRELHFD